MTTPVTATNIAVVKFGSSVLSKVEVIPEAIHAVYYYLRHGYKVLAVISALGDTTDSLVNETKKLMGEENLTLPPQEYATLLATGEISAASLFTIGLDRAGIKARKLDHRCLLTEGSVLNADPVSLNSELIKQLFQHYSVLVLPGFIGCDAQTEVTLLGRGGSDYTAIFAAWALNASTCVIYKDTPGIFNQDPKENPATAKHFDRISYPDCLKTSYEVIQHKAVRFAQSKQFQFSVKSLTSVMQTVVGTQNSILTEIKLQPKKLKVVLLGLGTVGLGVYKHLAANKALFDVVGIVVKHIAKHQHHDAPAGLISDNLAEILERECDVVVELVGGIQWPKQWLTAALERGCHVITANKALIAEQGLALSQLAAKHNVKLHYSGAVAGAVPILETLKYLQQHKPNSQIQSVTGILNGTCNFVLEQIKEGKTFAEAVKAAQLSGFAESDPSFDIEGLDAAQKATIIARLAFGRDPDSIEVQGIENICEQNLRQQHTAGNNIKLIASCVLDDGKIHANVKPLALSATHPLAKVTEANNAVLIAAQGEEVIHLQGKGAGRWPTAEAVFADLLELSFSQAQ